MPDYYTRQKQYEIAVSYYSNSLRMLFQRLNYLLITTAFLITGFVAVIITDKFEKYTPNNELFWLAITIAAIGLLVSYGFTLANFLNAKIIYRIAKYVRQIETGYSYQLPFTEIHEIAIENYINYIMIFSLPVHTIAYLFGTSIERWKGEEKGKARCNAFAPHTWLIPIFFTLVWASLIIFITTRTPLIYIVAIEFFVILFLGTLGTWGWYATRNKLKRIFLILILVVIALVVLNWSLSGFEFKHFSILWM